jgi:hypothetical protein
VPQLQELLHQWRRRVLWLDGTLFGLGLLGLIVWTLWSGVWEGLSFTHAGWSSLLGSPTWSLVTLVATIALAVWAHFSIRRLTAKRIMIRLQRQLRNLHERDFVEGLLNAFRKNTRFWRSILMKHPAGWGARARRQIADVLAEANGYVQDLNDKFTNPSGAATDAEGSATPPNVVNDSLTESTVPSVSELSSEASTVAPNVTP